MEDFKSILKLILGIMSVIQLVKYYRTLKENDGIMAIILIVLART